MKHHLLILISACIATTSFIGWRVHVIRHETTNAYGAVYDPSLSFTGGCRALVGSVDHLLHSPGVSATATLTAFVLGDASTAAEPRRLATYAIPTDRKVIEGKQASAKRTVSLLRDVWGRCESVRPTLMTPIYLGIQQTLADLHAKGCKVGSRCSLWVATDLEENVDHGIKARLRGSRAAAAPLPRALDNRGIQVTFCGFAQTAGRIVGPSGREIGKAAARGPNQDARLRSVWRSLFSIPQLVSFEPYCPQPSVLVLREAPKLATPSEASK